MKSLEVKAISKKYKASNNEAVQNVSLSVSAGEVLVVVGESGSGKTTLLRLIAGLEYPDAGEIHFGEKVFSSNMVFMPTEQRNVGLVFQDYALFPHFDLMQNVAFGIKPKGKERTSRAKQYLEMVGLGSSTEKYPHELSGGEKQRVALARALASNPDLILMDEPFSNLDTTNKVRLRDDVRSLLKDENKAVILVTHDIEDAMILGDRVAVMSNGAILQVGNPEDVYFSPVSSYVAELFGAVNLIHGSVSNGQFVSNDEKISVSLSGDNSGNTLCLRPECLELCPPGQGLADGVLEQSQFVEGNYRLTLKWEGSTARNELTIRSTSNDWQVGKKYGWRIVTNKLSIVDSDEP